jgi:hypothetical protein
MQALMVMTDGVADDYFPPDPELARLYADLVLNRVLNLSGPPEEKLKEVLAGTSLKSLDEVAQAPFRTQLHAIEKEGPRPVTIRSAATYADQLGLPLEELVKSPALLHAGGHGEPICPKAATAQERLRLWLDSYQVRGSFDDRTLVVLHREKLG